MQGTNEICIWCEPSTPALHCRHCLHPCLRVSGVVHVAHASALTCLNVHGLRAALACCEWYLAAFYACSWLQAKEGRIEHGSVQWAQLSERDQRKRLNSIKEANLKLKSPNFFVSLTRLRLMNVPAAWDENQLKACCHKAVLERATRAEPTISQV
jgi:hypothetical protein